ncbi:MAG: outer membrane beta-barrel protein [Phycisphaerales bacterium]|nr:outer membrane beta-barrel protein [Phycisphaerales bacterium]
MFTPLKYRIFAALSLVLLAAPASFAQTTGDGGPDPSLVRVRLGPLWMNPTISMPNIGIDTNVFNDPPNVTPKKDFTVTVSPKTELWLRMGRTWLSGLIAEEVVWYQKYTTERSANSTYTIGWRAPLNRLVLTTSATWLSTRARPGFEIDARARRKEPTYTGSVEVRGFAKTYIGVRGSWNRVRFDQSAVFKGSSLQEQLDRTATSAAVTLRHELTPLTSITFTVGRSEERFKSAPSRNSTSNDYSVGLTFDPAALIKGSATLGYTVYEPEAADLAGYRGTTAAAGLSYTLLGSTRFAGTITRGVEFSYDINQPYYLLTGGTASFAQQIFGPFDVVARGGAQRLKYQSRVGAIVTDPDRTDHVRSYGLGVGIHMGPELRLGFNLDKERRTSVLTDRRYKGLKYGSSITYGLQ